MKNLAVFASGTGTNFEAISDACADGRLDARVAILVCDHPEAPVVGKAAARGIRTFAFTPKDYESKAAFETEIACLLDSLDIDLVCLAGYMRIVGEVLLGRYGGRIIAQRAYAYDGDDIGEVIRMGHEIEYELYVDTIKKILE